MSQKRYCDRCGRDITRESYHRIKLSQLTAAPSEDHYSVHTHDICEHCGRDFVSSWMNPPRVVTP